MSNCPIGECVHILFHMYKHDVTDHIIRILMKFAFKLCLKDLAGNIESNKLSLGSLIYHIEMGGGGDGKYRIGV
jgi:hypothetical protein